VIGAVNTPSHRSASMFARNNFEYGAIRGSGKCVCDYLRQGGHSEHPPLHYLHGGTLKLRTLLTFFNICSIHFKGFFTLCIMAKTTTNKSVQEWIVPNTRCVLMIEDNLLSMRLTCISVVVGSLQQRLHGEQVDGTFAHDQCLERQIALGDPLLDRYFLSPRF
jgi:hypothetical protein